MHLDRGNLALVYSLHGTPLEVVSEYCDVDVTIDYTLTFYQHIGKIVKKVNTVYYLVHHVFPHCYIDDAITLYKSYVRPTLEFNIVSWNPWYVLEVNCVEKVQRRYAKRIWSDDSVSYSDRCQVCKLQTVESRRRIVDLICLHRALRENTALANIKM